MSTKIIQVDGMVNTNFADSWNDEIVNKNYVEIELMKWLTRTVREKNRDNLFILHISLLT